MKLYELSDSYNALWDLVDNEEADLQAIEDTLQAIEGAIEDKAESIANIIRQIAVEAKTIKAEEDRLEKRRKARENKAEGLKGYLQSQMEAAKLKNIKTPTLTIRIQRSRPSVRIIDEAVIPQKYFNIVPEEKNPDKNQIYAAIKAGEVIPGCELVSSEKLRFN